MPVHDDDDDYLEQAKNDPELAMMLENFRNIAEPHRGKFLRMMERMAALPREVQSTITREKMWQMMEDDEDFRYN